MPNLLIAPKEIKDVEDNEAHHGAGDDRMLGYYEDGAYTAAPVRDHSSSPDAVAGEDEEEDPQDVYHKSLLRRYHTLRANLRTSPPSADVLAALDQEHSTTISGYSQAQRARWRQCLRFSDPLPAQVVSMDQETVLWLLRFLTTDFVKRKHNVEARVAAWTWVLLGKLGEVGCLSSEDVSIVRDLGKQAVRVLIGIREAWENGELWGGTNGKDASGVPVKGLNERPEDLKRDAGVAAIDVNSSILESGDPHAQSADERPAVSVDHDPSRDLLEDVEEGEVKDDNEPAEGLSGDDANASLETPKRSTIRTRKEIGEAKEHLPAHVVADSPPNDVKPDERFPSSNTRAVLDMIITIVGECYGQRDLLEFREIWGEYDS